MTFKATVIEGGKLLLENGARLKFAADDCAERLKPGDAVILETAKTPSIRKASKSGAYTPVRETKISLVEETKALIVALGDEL
jgi:hypothetical protein